MYGGAYLLPNEHLDAPASLYQPGTIGFDKVSGTMYYLERDRSRLFSISDSILGAAKIGHAPRRLWKNEESIVDPFGPEAGERTYADLRPDRYFGVPDELVPRSGPYVGVFIGSSLTATSDLASQYSLGRAVDRELSRELELKDGLRLHLFCRMRGGLTFDQSVELLEMYYETGLRADVAIIEVMLVPRFSDDDLVLLLDRLRGLEAANEAKFILFDNRHLQSKHGEGLEVTSADAQRLLEVAELMGFSVVRIGGRALTRYLETAPWGSPGYLYNHASPWAIDATAEMLTHNFYPIVSQHLAGRVPGWRRPDRPLVEAVAVEDLLRTAFASTKTSDAAANFPDIATHLLQKRFDRRSVTIYVDLNRIEKASDSLRRQAADLDRLALSVLYQVVVREATGGVATSAHLEIVRFANYDEYGQGTLTSAEVVFRRSFTRADLETFIGSALR